MKKLKVFQKLTIGACCLLGVQIYTILNIVHSEMSWKSPLSEHQHEGCPYNSICSKEMGEIFIKYHKHLQTGQLKKFFQTHGIPVTSLRKKGEKKSSLFEAIWDSPCGYKANKKSMFERVMTFAKKFETNKNQYPFYVLLSPKGVINKYFSSSDDSVLGFHRDRLIFNRLVEGIYYQYQVNSKGEIKLNKEQKISKFSKKITCSSDLLTKVSGQFSSGKIDAVSCREIYSSSGDKSYLFYLPRCE